VLRLDDLSADEVALWDALAGRGVFDGCTGVDDDPADALKWAAGRCVNARLLVHCLTADLPGVRLIRLRGVRVVGAIDLRGVKDMRALMLEQCRTDGIVLAEASIAGSLAILDSHVAGQLNLFQATISGNLNLTGTRITGNDGVALVGDQLRVSNGVFLRAGFRADGTVRLPGAAIGGQLDASGARLSGDKVALNLTSARIGAELLMINSGPGTVLAKRGFSARGEIVLSAAHVDGPIECGGTLTAGETGIALRANGVEAKSNLALVGLATVKGEVRIVGSSVGRDLSV
jgi:hypothetical protein